MVTAGSPERGQSGERGLTVTRERSARSFPPTTTFVTITVELARFARRLIGTLYVATLAVFVAIEISIPRGFATVILPIGADPTSERFRPLVEQYHLDRHIVVRHLLWIGEVFQGELNESTRGVPISELVLPRLSISLQFVLVSLAGTLLIGIPLGLLAAAWHRDRRGTALNTIFGLSQSIPIFITPVFLIWLFALELRWLPAAGWVRIGTSFWGNLETLILPASALIFAEIGPVARIVRADALVVLRTDFVAAAIGKGLSPAYVLARHALRPASLGLLNVIGLNVGTLLSGTMLIEIIFGIGGLGQLLLEASLNRDLYLLLALTSYVVVVYVSINAAVDLAMRLLDPRLNAGRDG
ncbi:MAG: ABC transporter permease [Actinomycetota bacterium]